MRNQGKTRVLAAAGLAAALVLAGCGSSSDDSGADEASQQEETTTEPQEDDSDEDSATATESPEASEPTSVDSGDIEVDRGLLSVEVTLPADFISVGSETPPTEEELKEAIAEDGSNMEVTLNDDGSATYRMSRGEYNRILDDLRASVDESVQEVIDEEPNIYESVTYSNDLKEFDVVVDREAYESSMSFLSLTLLFQGAFYQAFAGVPENERFVIIRTTDAATGEVFDTYDSREEE